MVKKLWTKFVAQDKDQGVTDTTSTSQNKIQEKGNMQTLSIENLPQQIF